MTTLFSRLSMVFTGILLCLGIVALNIGHQSQQRYFEEFTQELNRPVAMYIANQTRLFVDGQPDKQALVELASHVMMINPSLDVYLLDPQGSILAAAPPGNTILTKTVDLQPVRRFLAGEERFPVMGDNPAEPGQRRVFSAFPVSGTDTENSGCDQCGYLYVVLGGARHRSLWQSLSSSYTLQAGATMFVGVLVFALIAGIAVFFMMTRPLRALTRALAERRLIMAGNMADHGTHTVSLESRESRPADELEMLERTCLSMAQRLDQQFLTLASADNRRRRFLTSVSHDLRTPLTSLSGAIETVLMKNEQMSATELQRYLKLAQRQANRLGRLTSQLFEMARLDSGDVKLHAEPLSLSDLVFDTVQDLEAEAAGKGIVLTVCNASNRANVPVLADMGMIQRVLENLAFNAIRHTPQGGHVELSIRVGADQSGIVEVTDSGGGFCTRMDACPLQNCIDLEGNEESLNSVNAEGSGLGLGIVQRILALHGTQAEVWSQPGKGTRIRFSLPLSH